MERDKKRTRVVLSQLRQPGAANSYGVLVNENEADGSKLKGDVSAEEGDSYIVSKGRLVLLNLAWFGLMLTMMVLIVAAIPAQIDFLVGRERKAQALALLATLCSVFVLILSPIFGYISDNWRSKYGRRRVFMIAGVALSCLGLLVAGLIAPYFSAKQKLVAENSDTSLLACNITKPQCSSANSSLVSFKGMVSHSVDRDFALYIFAIVIYFTGNSLASTAFTGLIADKTHPSARGFSSGIMGVMVLCGNMAGAGIGILSDELLVVGTFTVLSVVSFITVVITCVFTPEIPTNVIASLKSEMSVKDMLLGYVRPFKSADFTWMFISRFLLQMGLATSVGFLQYWLDDIIDLPNCMSPMRAVSLLFIPMMVCGAISSGVGGLLTDKLQKRKIFVYFSASMMTACVVIMIFATTYWLVIVLMIVIGVGYGAYVAVDMAMVFDILPNASERAKDLAVWHQALLLPQIIATPLGGVIVHGFQHLKLSNGAHGCEYGLGYKILFGVTALYFLISVILIRKIKGIA